MNIRQILDLFITCTICTYTIFFGKVRPNHQAYSIREDQPPTFSRSKYNFLRFTNKKLKYQEAAAPTFLVECKELK